QCSIDLVRAPAPRRRPGAGGRGGRRDRGGRRGSRGLPAGTAGARHPALTPTEPHPSRITPERDRNNARYFMPVIIWLNGGFGAGKTTLAGELRRRLPDAVVYDPEDVGLMLWKWLPPDGDFQHLPSWRELVVATALSLRRHHADTLIVPMSLTRDAYRAEILGGLADAGEQVLHVFLEAEAAVLRERLDARVDGIPDNFETNQSAREWALRIDAAVVAAARQPGGTLMLRSDRLTPAELADEVLAAAGLDQKLPKAVSTRFRAAPDGVSQVELRGFEPLTPCMQGRCATTAP